MGLTKEISLSVQQPALVSCSISYDPISRARRLLLREDHHLFQLPPLYFPGQTLRQRRKEQDALRHLVVRDAATYEFAEFAFRGLEHTSRRTGHQS